MSQDRVEQHKVVSITYSITDEQGEIHEQSDLPIDYVHGADDRLFEKIEQGLDGHSVGDKVQVTLTPEEGFGEHNAELTYTDRIDNVPTEYQRLGAEAVFANEEGETVTMVVTRIGDGMVTLDGNHPLAGKTITFNIKVVAVRDATGEEIASGRASTAASDLTH